jgi:hypothetical protein
MRRRRNVQPKSANRSSTLAENKDGVNGLSSKPSGGSMRQEGSAPSFLNHIEKKQHWLDHWVAFLALITAIGAFGAALWQAFIAHEALIAGQRAFVHLETIAHDIADNWTTDSGCCIWNVPHNEGKMIRSKFLFTNAGNTPTKAASIDITCKLIGPGTRTDDPFELLNFSYTINRSIGAKQTITIGDIDGCNFKNQDVLLNAQMQVVPVYLVGQIRYEDWIRPGKMHVTQFVHRLVVNDVGKMPGFAGMDVTTVPIGKHNCTDEDCPVNKKAH